MGFWTSFIALEISDSCYRTVGFNLSDCIKSWTLPIKLFGSDKITSAIDFRMNTRWEESHTWGWKEVISNALVKSYDLICTVKMFHGVVSCCCGVGYCAHGYLVGGLRPLLWVVVGWLSFDLTMSDTAFWQADWNICQIVLSRWYKAKTARNVPTVATFKHEISPPVCKMSFSSLCIPMYQ